MGRDYVLLQLKLGGKGPFDFVVDTGLTAEMITPHLRQVGAALERQRPIPCPCKPLFPGGSLDEGDERGVRRQA